MSGAEPISDLIQAQRVLVLGPSGAGKTRLSRRLGSLLGLQVVHLDAHFWRPGWVPSPIDEWRERVAALAAKDEWVMDGTYEASLDLRLPRADAVVYVAAGRLGCLWRVFKRTRLAPDPRRGDAPAGQKLDTPFFRYIWHFHGVTEPFIQAEIAKHGLAGRTIPVTGPRGGAHLLARLQSLIIESRNTEPEGQESLSPNPPAPR